MSERKLKNELIDKFLKEELSEKELTVFKKYWNTEPAFVKEVRDYSRLKVALKVANRIEQENAFDFKLIPFMKKAFYKYQSVAAVMLMAVMLPLYLLLQGQKVAITPESPEVKTLARANFIQDRLLKHFDEFEVNADATWKVQLNESFEALKNKELTDASDYFLLADFYFMNNKPKEALQCYKQGLSKNPIDHDAQWNILMAQLATGRLVDVKLELNRLIKTPNSFHRDLANELILKLD